MKLKIKNGINVEFNGEELCIDGFSISAHDLKEMLKELYFHSQSKYVDSKGQEYLGTKIGVRCFDLMLYWEEVNLIMKELVQEGFPVL